MYYVQSLKFNLQFATESKFLTLQFSNEWR